jgi:uncharacterized protein (TIGR00251 family)
MIQVSDHPEGCVVAVRAQPGARRNAVLGEQAEALKVAVTAPPDKGRANEAIVELLSSWLGIKRSQVELVSGATSRLKKFLLRGLKAEAVRRKVI